jgi:RNA polymerase sigma factor (sigma-70 family)
VTPLLLRTQTDARLLSLAASGHDRAFEAIVERYRKPLMRYLRRLLSEPLAEDVVQATFLNAWRALQAGTDVRELRPWLYRIGHNQAINALKRAGAALEPLADGATVALVEAGPDAEVERRDEMRLALEGVAALPDRQRTALLAVAVEGRAHADVARELGLTDGAVRQLVHRARSSLRTVATAITPSPLVGAVASSHDVTAARVAELAAGAGSAGVAGFALKAGAVAVTAGAVMAGVPERDASAPTRAAAPKAAVASAAPSAQPRTQSFIMHDAPAAVVTTHRARSSHHAGAKHRSSGRHGASDRSGPSHHGGHGGEGSRHATAIPSTGFHHGSHSGHDESTSGHQGGGDDATDGGHGGSGGGHEQVAESHRGSDAGGGDHHSGGGDDDAARTLTTEDHGGGHSGSGGGTADPVETAPAPEPTDADDVTSTVALPSGAPVPDESPSGSGGSGGGGGGHGNGGGGGESSTTTTPSP